MSENEKTIEQTLTLLRENDEWINRYIKYSDLLLGTETTHGRLFLYQKAANSFRLMYPLSGYTSISRIEKGNYFDVRFLGQSIGEVMVDRKKQIWFQCSDGYENVRTQLNATKYKLDSFDYKLNKKGEKIWTKERWDSPIVVKMRSVFHNLGISVSFTHSQEHRCENLLLREFAKQKSAEKSLCNIQPVKLAGKFIQIPTPLHASDKKKPNTYSAEKGGGIDILARVRHKNNVVCPCVFELKDEDKKNESIDIVIKQALSYATFLARLLQEVPSWWRLIGYHHIPKKDRRIIDVVGLMPQGTNAPLPMEYYTIKGKSKEDDIMLQIHTLYFDRDALYHDEKFNFSGSYVNEILCRL